MGDRDIEVAVKALKDKQFELRQSLHSSNKDLANVASTLSLIAENITATIGKLEDLDWSIRTLQKNERA